MQKTTFVIVCAALFLTACTTGEKEPKTWTRDLGSSQAETVNKNIPLIEKQLEEPKKTVRFTRRAKQKKR